MKMPPPPQAAVPKMNLNLGNQQPQKKMPAMGLGLNLNAVQRNDDVQMQEEMPPRDRTHPAMQPSMKIPSLKLGDVSSTPDPQPSNESAGKPKMSFGLDLSKAK